MAQKPKKPYKDFPLYAHATGRWAKKIRCKLYYFGPWDDWQGALAKYLDERDDLQAGRTPRVKDGSVTVQDLCEHFVAYKQHLVDTGELSSRTFTGYKRSCINIGLKLGLNLEVQSLTQMDLLRLRGKLAEGRKLVALGNEIRVTRMLLKYAHDMDLIDKPIKPGVGLRMPARDKIRQERQARGKRLYAASEVKSLLDAATVPLKAMILLAVNCGFGNTDVAKLPKSALDLKGGWVDFPRPKTGVPRRCPLWPETIEAVRVAINDRPAPADESHAGLVFVTKSGNIWVRHSQKGTNFDAVNLEFGKLLAEVKIDRPGLAFYALRHTFQTIADGARDPVAVQSLMGHSAAGDDMGAVYREEVSDDRLLAVTNHVHQWLYGRPEGHL